MYFHLSTSSINICSQMFKVSSFCPNPPPRHIHHKKSCITGRIQTKRLRRLPQGQAGLGSASFLFLHGGHGGDNPPVHIFGGYHCIVHSQCHCQASQTHLVQRSSSLLKSCGTAQFTQYFCTKVFISKTERTPSPSQI